MDNGTVRIARILGTRAFWVGGSVTLLVVTLLATINLSSRHALKLYIEDQINRLPWMWQSIRLRNSIPTPRS